MISSLAQTSAIARASTARLQEELGRAQQELASGRHFDLGRTYGARAATASSIRANISEVETLKDGNKVASARLSATGAALGSLTSIAQTLQQQLLDVSPGAADAKTIQEAGLAALNQTIAVANTGFDGVYLFAGLNAGGKPLSGFLPGSGNGPSEGLAQAFQAQFGTLPGDQANASIAPSDMQSFLDTALAQMFTLAGWKDNWSGASDVGGDFRISESASLQYPALGNSAGLRGLVQSLTMVAGLGLDTLNAESRQLVIDRAASTLGNAIAALSVTAGEVGVNQNRIETANQELSLQSVHLATRLDELETADPAEISARISTLSAQLQASYEVTARLAHLSLVNYL